MNLTDMTPAQQDESMERYFAERGITDIAPAFNGVLIAIAADLAADRPTKVELHSSWDYRALLLKRITLAAFNKHIAAASNGKYRIEASSSEETGFEVFGAAAYFSRVDNETGEKRFFFIGPYDPGMQYIFRRPDR